MEQIVIRQMTRKQQEEVALSIHHVDYGSSLSGAIECEQAYVAQPTWDHEQENARRYHQRRLQVLEDIRDRKPVQYGKWGVVNHDHYCGLAVLTGENVSKVRQWLDS